MRSPTSNIETPPTDFGDACAYTNRGRPLASFLGATSAEVVGRATLAALVRAGPAAARRRFLRTGWSADILPSLPWTQARDPCLRDPRARAFRPAATANRGPPRSGSR